MSYWEFLCIGPSPRVQTGVQTPKSKNARVETGEFKSREYYNNKSVPFNNTVRRYNINYMHDPPGITPNLGKMKRRVVPKTNISKVLLYDNATQDKMLDENLSVINNAEWRAVQRYYLKRYAFLKRRSVRMDKLQEFSANVSHQVKQFHAQYMPIEQKSGSTSRCSSSLSYLDGLKLPQIDVDGDRRHVVFKCKGTDGKVSVYYTVDNAGIFSEAIPTFAFYQSIADDPRFQELEESLERISIDCGGYSELSPSYRRVADTLPEHINEIKQIKREQRKETETVANHIKNNGEINKETVKEDETVLKHTDGSKTGQRKSELI